MKSFTLSPSRRKWASVNSLTIDRTSLSFALHQIKISLEPSLQPSIQSTKKLTLKLFCLESQEIKSVSTISNLVGRASSTIQIFSFLAMSSFAFRKKAMSSQVSIHTPSNHQGTTRAHQEKISFWTLLETMGRLCLKIMRSFRYTSSND